MELKQHLVPKLKALRLSGVLDTLELRTQQAIAEHWSYGDFLERLLEDEVERRGQKQLALRLRRPWLLPVVGVAALLSAVVLLLRFWPTRPPRDDRRPAAGSSSARWCPSGGWRSPPRGGSTWFATASPSPAVSNCCARPGLW